MKRRSLCIVAALIGVAAVRPVAADGTSGPMPRGTATISATVPPPPAAVGTRITGLQDIALGNYSGSGTTSFMEMPVCIYHSAPDVGFTLRQPGREIGDRLQLTGPNGWRLNIEFGFRQPSGFGFVWRATEAGGPGVVFNRESETCETGPMGVLRGRIIGAMDAQGNDGVAPPGNYNGVVQILLWTF